MKAIIPPATQLTDDLIEQLPDDIQAIIEAKEAQREDIIAKLVEDILGKRTEAVKHREMSGIENEWTEDEEFYEGIDDANRGEPRMIKPNHPTGAVTSYNKRNKKTRSTIFMNITRQYVDSAAASVSEMNNPNDDRNFSLRPLIDPLIEEKKNSTKPYVPEPDDDSNRPGIFHKIMNAVGLAQAQPQQPQLTEGEWATQQIADREKRAKASQDQIDDWLIACNWHAEMRKAVFAAAKIGTGCIKGPVPMVKRTKRQEKIKDATGKVTGTTLIVQDDILPGSKEISAWNIYPDPACGGNIQKGNFLFERDELNARKLREMKKISGYMSKKIDDVLKDGPQQVGPSENNKAARDPAESKEAYVTWYYYGILTREQIEAMGVPDQYDETDEEDKKVLDRLEELESCPCIVTLVGDTPIRASLNPLDSGEFPYDMVVWEARGNVPWGRGIARIMRPAQRIVTAAVRNLMDNAGTSSGVILGIKKGAVKPAGTGDWRVGPGSVYEIIAPDVDDINKVFSQFQVASRQEELLAIIAFGQKMAEDITGMPLLTQGQIGAAPDTVGGMQLLNQNSTTTRRMVARRIDDELVEPHIRRYYDWIMMYGDEALKGDVIIDARGSQALVERDIQRQVTNNILQYAEKPIYGIDPKKAMQETLRSNMCNPTDWQYTDDEWKQVQQQMQQQGNPALQAAQIRAQATIQAAQIHAQGSVQSTQLRTERDAAYEATVAKKVEMEREVQLRELALRERLALLDYANKRDMKLADVKAELANTTMRLQTEKELAATAASFEQTVHQDNQLENVSQRAHERTQQAAEHVHDINVANLQPDVQLPGRAAPGHALDQMPPAALDNNR